MRTCLHGLVLGPLLTDAAQEPALRPFLAWTETASRRILHLERP
jgi:hypothetical protein